jgi:hypothetical protein
LNFDAKCSLVQLQSVAATARLSLEGTLKKKNSGALLTITEARHGLVNSLELFQDVATSFETASAHHTASNQLPQGFFASLLAH